MQSDPIADLLTRIRNGAQARLSSVEIPHSKIKVEIVKILENEGYISAHEITTESKFPSIKVHLRYDTHNKPLLSSIKRISRPGLRVYRKSGDLRAKRSGLTTQIISTSAGLMTDREARKKKVGGEVLCEVY